MNRLILIFLLLPWVLFAQEEVKVHAETSVKSFFLGEAFTLNVLVSGTESVKAPEMSMVNDFVVKKVSESAVSLKDKKGYIIRYKLLAKKDGNLVIPPLGVKVNGALMETGEIKLEVKKPLTHKGLKVKVHLSQLEAFVGEPILATFTLSSELPLYAFNAVDITYPFLTHYGFKVYDTHNSPKSGDKNSIGLPVSNTRIIALRGNDKKGDVNLDTITFKKIIIPRVSGELTVKAATFLASYTPPEVKAPGKRNWQPQYPSHFNNNFFEEVEGKSYEKYFASSNEIKLLIKALPMKGKPSDFKGLVGKCEVSATAEPAIVEAGAPVSLRIVVSGHEYPAIPELPELGKQLAFNRNFSIPSRQSTGRVENKEKVFLRTLRPLRTDVSEIPVIRIPYFDPHTETYGLAQTETIALTVTPATTVTAFDADISGGKVLKNKLEMNKEGIHHNSLSLGALKRQRLASPLLLAAIFVPPLLYLLFLVVTAESRLLLNDPVAARKKFAFRKFKKGLSSVKDIESLEKIVRSYIADSLNLVSDAHTFVEIEDKLPEKDALMKIYKTFETKRFSKSSGNEDFSQLKEDAVKAILSLNGRLKHV
ncbi:MAG: BatD family protein [Lentisphaeraceae bacterium]|nr:BatD family protein [Lentisphaeraceae bacterium]